MAHTKFHFTPIITSVQYYEVCSVLQGVSISTVEDSISTVEVKHQYSGGCSVSRSAEPTLYRVVRQNSNNIDFIVQESCKSWMSRCDLLHAAM